MSCWVHETIGDHTQLPVGFIHIIPDVVQIELTVEDCQDIEGVISVDRNMCMQSILHN